MHLQERATKSGAPAGHAMMSEEFELAERWSPQRGPQLDAIQATWVEELLYGGAAGGGKSDYLLGDFLQDVPTYGKAWRGIIFRRTYGELEELMGRAQELYPQTGATWNEQKKTWTWPNGAFLRFRYLEQLKHRTRYQGAAYTWIGWDELTQWATDAAYRYLRARLRSKYDVPTKRIRATANPGGVGHHWVKAYFVRPCREGFKKIFDPVTQAHRMFVPAKLSQNLILIRNDPSYKNRLAGLGSEAMVRAWLDGDWDVVEGAFFDCWRGDRHVVKPFAIPHTWTRFMSGDWGSASPFSFGWWAVVQDDYRMANGRVLPRGALVRYREWYGTKDPAKDAQRGLKLDANEVGRRLALMEGNDPRCAYGVLDPSCFKDIGGGPTIAERLNEELTGLKRRAFHEADNTRVTTRDSKDRRGPMAGWDQMRARLVGKLSDKGKPMGVPMIYCFDTCVASIRTIPVLQHDLVKPEDLDTESEDHAADDWRYACSSRPWVRKIPEAELERNPYAPKDDDLIDGQEISVLTL